MYKITKEDIAQINLWTKNGIHADSKTVRDSALYKKLSDDTCIIASNCNFTKDGLLLFANIITELQNITELGMSNNKLGEHAVDFGKAIAKSTITNLDMSGNNIEEHAVDFGKAIAESTITKLDMSNNRIGEHAVDFGKAIAESNIINLNIAYNNIKAQIEDFVKCIAHHLPNLEHLHGDRGLFNQTKQEYEAIKQKMESELQEFIIKDTGTIVMEFFGNPLINMEANNHAVAIPVIGENNGEAPYIPAPYEAKVEGWHDG